MHGLETIGWLCDVVYGFFPVRFVWGSYHVLVLWKLLADMRAETAQDRSLPEEEMPDESAWETVDDL